MNSYIPLSIQLFFLIVSSANFTTTYQKPGSDFSLTCDGLDSVNFTLVQWIGPRGQHRQSSSSSYSLDLHNITLTDSGNYSCRVFNLNDRLFESVYELIVRGMFNRVFRIPSDKPDPPIDIRSVNNRLHSLEFHWKFGLNHGSNIILHNLHLNNGSESIHEKNVSFPSQMTIFKNLRPGTCYNLLIRALSTVGWSHWSTAFHTATLDDSAISHTPLFNVTSVSNTSVKLTSGPLSFLPNKRISSSKCNETTELSPGEYAVNISTSDKSHIQTDLFSVEAETNQTLTLVNLKPFTAYTISIAFKHADLFGPIQLLRVKTLEGLPDAPSITFSSADIRTIHIHWTNGRQSNGKITQYKLELYPCPPDVAYLDPNHLLHRIQIDASLTSHRFSQLDSNTCYSARVASGTNAGFGPFSPLLAVFTDVEPPQPPHLLSVVLLNTTHLHLHWGPDNSTSSPPRALPVHFLVCWRRLPSTGDDGEIVIDRSLSSCSPVPRVGVGSNNLILPLPTSEFMSDGKFEFTMRTVVTSRQCAHSVNHCPRESVDSNVVPLTISGTDVEHSYWMPNWDGFALFGIIATVGVILAIVITITCFINRSDRLPFLGRNSVTLWPRKVEVQPKSRRSTPFRFNKTVHKPIQRGDLASCVAGLHENDDSGFQTEFRDVEHAVSSDFASSVANLPVNTTKNRYSNVLAYDHSRVVLRDAGPKSDYINANFVDGYHRRAAYIAAQGPIPATFDDFWLMIWQQNTNIIVMISNFIERGRRKCDKYWPDGRHVYGLIAVRMLAEDCLAFYTQRVFAIRPVKCRRSLKERLVYHYQYTDWRDFDVPPSPLPVLKFVQESITHWSMDDGPIVAHCSAGVGRTGTYICIESLIRQLRVENLVSVRDFLEHIRHQRMKLVQTEKQYAFIHDVLVEYALQPLQPIHSTHLSDHIDRLHELDSSSQSRLERQFKMCSQVGSTVRARHPSSNLPRVGSGGDTCSPAVAAYNAVPHFASLHGYRQLDEYVIAVHPNQPQTEAEFWKMVWERNSSLIICLSDPASTSQHVFWPSQDEKVRDIDWLHITLAQPPSRLPSSTTTTLQRFSFLLTSDREDYALGCCLLAFQPGANWPSSTTTDLASPESVDGVRCLLSLASPPHRNSQLPLALVDHQLATSGTDLAVLNGTIDSQMSQSGPMVVVDETGGFRAGTFCALRILLEQLVNEDKVDVYFACKLLFQHRPQIFQSPAQMEFIYRLLDHFVKTQPSPSLLTTLGSASAYHQHHYYQTVSSTLPGSLSSGLHHHQGVSSSLTRKRPLSRLLLPLSSYSTSTSNSSSKSRRLRLSSFNGTASSLLHHTDSTITATETTAHCPLLLSGPSDSTITPDDDGDIAANHGKKEPAMDDSSSVVATNLLQTHHQDDGSDVV